MAHPVWLALILNWFILCVTSKYAKTCNITSYGAKGDGKTDNTESIQKAIYECSNATINNNTSLSSLVILPKYYSNGAPTVYMSGAIWLESNIDFYIEKDVILLGIPCGNLSSNNISYPWVYTRNGGIMQYNPSSLMNGGICEEIDYNSSLIGDQCTKWKKLSNVKIFGYGTINGNGHSGWYDEPFKDNRPCLIDLLWINNLQIFNVTITNSPNWTLHPIFCTNIFIDNITILTDGPNTDGLDPDSCSNVLITNSYISTGDDCIAIKSGKDADGRAVNISSNNITVRNVYFGNGHGITIGSEMSGNVTNILFDNLIADGTDNGPHIKSEIGRGGKIENVTYSNILLINVENGIVLSEQYDNNANTSGPPPIIQNIYYKNITGSATKESGEWICLQQEPCKQIYLDHVNITCTQNGYSCQNVYGQSTDVEPKSCINTNL